MTDTTIDRARALLILRESVRCADAVSMCNQMGDVLQELLAEVERLTLAASEHRDGRLAALERATAAEARLRELAIAEPVAWLKKNGFRFIGEIEPSDYETEVPLYTASPAPSVPDDVRNCLTEARDIAMRHALEARIPECGQFGAIAQDLDYVCHRMLDTTPGAPAPSVSEGWKQVPVEPTAASIYAGVAAYKRKAASVCRTPMVTICT